MNYVCPTREDDEKEEAVWSDGNCSPLEIDYVPGNGFSVAGRPNRRRSPAWTKTSGQETCIEMPELEFCEFNVPKCSPLVRPRQPLEKAVHIPAYSSPSIRHGLLAVSANQSKGRLSCKTDFQEEEFNLGRQSIREKRCEGVGREGGIVKARKK